MSVKDISNSDRINYINIGLIIISCAVAFVVPFELFLFSYAILGPLHYLTEISWLHERNYFSKGKRDYIFLALAGIILFLLIYVVPYLRISAKEPLLSDETSTTLRTALVYIAFACSLAMVLLKSPFQRFIAFVFICITSLIAQLPAMAILFSVFLPTLIHVFLFTLLFMLYGALKTRSKSGYLSCLLLVICPLLFIWFTPGVHISAYANQTYGMFDIMNKNLLELFNPGIFMTSLHSFHDYQIYFHQFIYETTYGIIAMRFIAFAYTYHYLNWFSKTSVIKWHKVPKKRLVVIGVLWVAAVVFYLWDYKLGFNVLFLLSFLHVFLEFPLNHVTIIGIFREIGSIMGGNKTPVPVKGKVKKK